MAKTILITGGAGYVGSHATVEMLNSGYECVVVDNLVNAHTGIWCWVLQFMHIIFHDTVMF